MGRSSTPARRSSDDHGFPEWQELDERRFGLRPGLLWPPGLASGRRGMVPRPDLHQRLGRHATDLPHPLPVTGRARPRILAEATGVDRGPARRPAPVHPQAPRHRLHRRRPPRGDLKRRLSRRRTGPSGRPFLQWSIDVWAGPITTPAWRSSAGAPSGEPPKRRLPPLSPERWRRASTTSTSRRRTVTPKPSSAH